MWVIDVIVVSKAVNTYVTDTNRSVVKYHLLLRSNNKAELVNLCKFIKESLSLRNQILNNIIFSVYLDLFNIITKMNSIISCLPCICMCACIVYVWVCEFACVNVCMCVCVCARVYVRVSQWVCKIYFFFIVTIRLTEICSFFISQICKYTWHISLYNFVLRRCTVCISLNKLYVCLYVSYPDINGSMSTPNLY